jgi:hypothetical protein
MQTKPTERILEIESKNRIMAEVFCFSRKKLMYNPVVVTIKLKEVRLQLRPPIDTDIHFIPPASHNFFHSSQHPPSKKA